MNSEILMDAVGKIDDEFIREAESASPHKVFKTPRIIAAAACLVVIVSSAVYISQNYDIFDKEAQIVKVPRTFEDSNEIFPNITNGNIQNEPEVQEETKESAQEKNENDAKKKISSKQQNKKTVKDQVPIEKEAAAVGKNQPETYSEKKTTDDVPSMGAGESSAPTPEPHSLNGKNGAQTIAESVRIPQEDEEQSSNGDTVFKSAGLTYSEYSDDAYSCFGDGYSLSVYHLADADKALEFSEILANDVESTECERYDIILVEFESDDCSLISVSGDSEPVGEITDKTLTDYSARILHSK